MIVTIFRSRLRPEAQQEYTPWAERMSELARNMPGYISHKVFAADDGERVTIVEFESEETQRIWASHPAHLEAQRKGRERFYSEFRVQVCILMRQAAHPQATAAEEKSR